ncbi:MAG: YbhB/YbcL family Raf kinase inhibitor-like protein [Schlesneria sp.]
MACVIFLVPRPRLKNWKATLFEACSCLLLTISSIGCSESINGSASVGPGSNVGSLIVTSPVFPNGGACPKEFTSDGIGLSPPFEWSGAPPETKSFAINLWRRNKDSNTDSTWISSYWVRYNIPPDITKLSKGEKEIGIEGWNDRSKKGYDPINAKQKGLNEYHLTVYALSEELKFETDKIPRQSLLDAIKRITLAQGTLDFRYEHLRKVHAIKQKSQK